MAKGTNFAFCSLFALAFAGPSYADITSPTFSGTITLTKYTDGVPQVITRPETMSLTFQTDKNGNALPSYVENQTEGNHTLIATYNNPTPLAGAISGYILEMSGSVDHGPSQTLGQLEEHGAPAAVCGCYASWSWIHSQVLDASNLFQTGSGSVTQNSNGSCIWSSYQTIVDANGKLAFTATVQLTSPARNSDDVP